MFPLVEALSPIISKVLDLIPDPNARAKAENEMQASLLKFAADQAAKEEEKATLKYRQEFFD